MDPVQSAPAPSPRPNPNPYPNPDPNPDSNSNPNSKPNPYPYLPVTVAYRILDERETIARAWADALAEARVLRLRGREDP